MRGPPGLLRPAFSKEVPSFAWPCSLPWKPRGLGSSQLPDLVFAYLDVCMAGTPQLSVALARLPPLARGASACVSRSVISHLQRGWPAGCPCLPRSSYQPCRDVNSAIGAAVGNEVFCDAHTRTTSEGQHPLQAIAELGDPQTALLLLPACLLPQACKVIYSSRVNLPLLHGVALAAFDEAVRARGPCRRAGLAVNFFRGLAASTLTTPLSSRTSLAFNQHDSVVQPAPRCRRHCGPRPFPDNGAAEAANAGGRVRPHLHAL